MEIPYVSVYAHERLLDHSAWTMTSCCCCGLRWIWAAWSPIWLKFRKRPNVHGMIEVRISKQTAGAESYHMISRDIRCTYVRKGWLASHWPWTSYNPWGFGIFTGQRKWKALKLTNLNFFELTSCRIGRDKLELSQEPPSSRKLKAQSKSWWLECQCACGLMEQLSSNRIPTMNNEHFIFYWFQNLSFLFTTSEQRSWRIIFENLVCRTALSPVASAKGLDLQRSKWYEEILDQI